MTKLSDAQRVILTRLAAGWRLQYLRMAEALWYDILGNPCGPCDLRSVNSLKQRGLIMYGQPENAPDEYGTIRYFALTDTGRQAIQEAT